MADRLPKGASTGFLSRQAGIGLPRRSIRFHASATSGSIATCPHLRGRHNEPDLSVTDFLLRHSGAFRMWLIAIAAAISLHVSATPAHAEAYLLFDANTGKVLQAENATQPWYPASLTKIMTAYVTLTAVKQGRISLDTLLTVSLNAVSQAPSKMGFPAGVKVTVDNALKMMMVKSANDMAVVLAEGVGGSIDGYSAMMKQTAHKLGMTQTRSV